MSLDTLAIAHTGCLRTNPPGTGAEPAIDSQLSAHMGFLVVGLAIPNPVLQVDQVFCIVTKHDDDFVIVRTRDEVFCVVLVDDDEVQL